MRIQLETGGQANLIRAYAVGQIIVNQDSYTRSLVVLPGRSSRTGHHGPLRSWPWHISPPSCRCVRSC